MHLHHGQVIVMTEDENPNGGYQPLRDLPRVMVDVQSAEMIEIDELLMGLPES